MEEEEEESLHRAKADGDDDGEDYSNVDAILVAEGVEYNQNMEKMKKKNADHTFLVTRNQRRGKRQKLDV